MSDVYYVVEQGFVDPRSRALGWRHWQYTDRCAEAVRLANKHEFGRVLRVHEIYTTPAVEAAVKA